MKLLKNIAFITASTIFFILCLVASIFCATLISALVSVMFGALAFLIRGNLFIDTVKFIAPILDVVLTIIFMFYFYNKFKQNKFLSKHTKSAWKDISDTIKNATPTSAEAISKYTEKAKNIISNKHNEVHTTNNDINTEQSSENNI